MIFNLIRSLLSNKRSNRMFIVNVYEQGRVVYTFMASKTLMQQSIAALKDLGWTYEIQECNY